MTTPSDLFMQSRIPYLVRKCEDASTPEERMAILAEIESEVEAYAAKRRVEAMREVVASISCPAWSSDETVANCRETIDHIRALIAKETP